MTLVVTVTNILCKRVSEAEAQKFALENYGVLCAYIRNQQVKELLANRHNESREQMLIKAKKLARKKQIN